MATSQLPPDMEYQEKILNEQEKQEKDLSLTENLIESAKELKEDIKESAHNFKEGLKEGAHELKKNVKAVVSHTDEISRDIVLG